MPEGVARCLDSRRCDPPFPTRYSRFPTSGARGSNSHVLGSVGHLAFPEGTSLLARHPSGQLSPDEPIQVSKRWKERLSSNAIYTAALKKYRIFPGLVVHESDFVGYAERRFALEYGRPFSKSVYPLDRVPFRRPDPGIYSVAHCQGQLAWAELDENHHPLGVALLCLRSGSLRRFVPQSRGAISHVQLSESLLVVVTVEGYVVRNVPQMSVNRGSDMSCFCEKNRYCTIWELSTEHRVSFRLPSALIQYVTVDRDRVAIITGGKPPDLLVWNLKTRVTRSVRIEGRPLIVGFHPGEDRLSILFLEVSDMSKVVRVRYSLAGEKVSPLEEPPASLALPRHYQVSRISGQWKYRSGIAGAAAVVVLASSDLSHPQPDLLFYYPETDKMSLRLSSQYPHLAEIRRMLMTSDGVMCLADESRPTSLQIWICDPDRRVPWRNLSFQSELWSSFRPDDCACYCDGEILAILSPSSIEVWSFNLDLDMRDAQRLWSPSRRRSRD